MWYNIRKRLLYIHLKSPRGCANMRLAPCVSDNYIMTSLSIWYNDSAYRFNLKGITDLNLIVGEGEFFGFIDPYCAEKSTTVRILLGLIRSTIDYAEVRKFFGKNYWNTFKSRLYTVRAYFLSRYESRGAYKVFLRFGKYGLDFGFFLVCQMTSLRL